jgi:hypothetical protein
MTYKLVRKLDKWSPIEIIQEGLGIKGALTVMHYSKNNAKGYYWLVPEEI